ncbi:MAG: hypothetical protein ACHQRM_14630 [Bacteroidia bacterium]
MNSSIKVRLLFSRLFPRRISLSGFAIFLICISWWYSAFQYDLFKKDQVVSDVVSYYAYLPAAFIHHDLSLAFTQKDKDRYIHRFWPEKAPNGGLVIKTTMGVSLLCAPFFGIGHLIATVSAYPADGFSPPYQYAVLCGIFIYTLVGFMFLRKLLLKFFSETTTFITLLGLFTGTNLLYYAAFTPLMAHALCFSLACIFLYYSVLFHEQTSYRNAAILGLLAALMTLMRPTMIALLLFPLLHQVSSVRAVRDKLLFLFQNRLKLLVLILVFILTGLPQLIYWKYTSGHWLFFSYEGEQFFWAHPHLFDGLFGYRKGWLRYTPLFLLAFAGIIPLLKSRRMVFLASLLPSFLLIYTLLCWWCWWYGGSFGARAFIDFYPLLAFPLAAFFQYVLTLKLPWRISFFTITTALILFNLFQTWEYYKGLIHYDSMTAETYRLSFTRTKLSGEFWASLKAPNYDAVLKGIDESIQALETYEANTVPAEFRTHLSKAVHHSGETSLVLNVDFPSTPELSIQTDLLYKRKATSLKTSVYIFIPENFREDEKDKARLTARILTPLGKEVWAQSLALNTVSKKGQWSEAVLSVKIPIDFPGDYQLLISVDNHNTTELLVDDLRIDAMP